MRHSFASASLFIAVSLSASLWGNGSFATEVDFNRDIRPILSDRCFVCHGPDQSSEEAQQTDLRLDDRQAAIDHGVFDFQNIDASELISRITSTDPDLQMPPADSHLKRVSEAEVGLLKQWIEQGAEYKQHWAYIPPSRPDVPEMQDNSHVANPIDAFVLRRLQSSPLTPSDTANRETLIRRVSYDLTGLPPSIDEIDAFLNDPRPLNVAYEAVVDRLLQSPHYGEQMARFWLDAARYADSSGYQYDRERKQWVWRDWVIHAFNTNMRFDDFTIQQLAGDLLEDATDQTRLATGFNRNHPITIEGGVVDEEYRTEYVMDRVVTTSTVWLGQTMLCARCHDHKYDPISQENFYQFYSFFNNVPERGLNGFDPKLTVASPLSSDHRALTDKVAKAQASFDALNLPWKNWEQAARESSADWEAQIPKEVKSSGGATPKQLDDKSVLMTGRNPAKDDYTLEFASPGPVAAIRLEAITHPSLTEGSASRGSNGNFVLSEFVVETKSTESDPFAQVTIVSAEADYEQKNFTINQAIDGKVNSSGWAVDGNTRPENRTAIFSLSEPIPAGSTVRITMKHRYGLSHQIGRFRISFSPRLTSGASTEKLLAIPANQRSTEQTLQLQAALVLDFGDPTARQAYLHVQELQEQLAKSSSFPATLIMKEMDTPRQAYILDRGEYDKPLKDRPVQPGVPEAMGSLPESAPKNRLGLARWLVAPDQPLTARVTVNRFWQQLFGTGLVKTSEDFGAQSEYPSHPDLLDWLAVEFMNSGWNVKHIMKTMVMSSTYRQSSEITEDAHRLDPNNRLLSHGPRIRLDGEVIRDTALAVSGLLERKIGGPSVYPYHPEGLWLEINNRPNFSRAYPHQTDPSQHHRRTLYTYWKRTVPPPSIATFDAPSREYCVVRRSSTNTPLQAFVMLHDPQFVEAARHLAARMLTEGGNDAESQIELGFRCCTGRSPSTRELRILLNAYANHHQKYQAEPSAADQLLSVGVTSVTTQTDPAKLAAMTQVARMLMNLSEFLTKG